MKFLASVGIAAFVLMVLPFSVAQAQSSSASSVVYSLSVTDDKASILPGASVIYAITVSQNSQPDAVGTLQLALPSYAELISANKGGTVNGTTVRWGDQTIQRNQSYVYTVQARYKTTTPNGENLLATATIGSSSATDSTLVGSASSSPSDSFVVTVTDNKTSAKPGDTLTYTVTARNMTAGSVVSEVRVRLPGFVEYTSASPTSTTQGLDLVWPSQTFAAGETKTYTIQATLDSRVTDYVALTTQAIAGSASAIDNTTVLRNPSSSSTSRSSSSSSSSVRSQSSTRTVLFAKESNKTEVLPGDTIRYTLFVQNILLNTINTATITDQFDPAQLSVEDAGGASYVGTGELRWTLPRLGPGEVWQRSYTLRVADALPHGTDLTNVASIAGSDLQTATLTEKVRTVRTGVVTDFPETGAPYDVLFLIGTAMLGIVAVASQKIAR